MTKIVTTNVVQKHTKGKEDSGRVGLVLSSDIRGGTSGRVKHSNINVTLVIEGVVTRSTCTEGTDQTGSHIGQEVTVFVQTDDNLVLLRVKDGLTEKSVEELDVMDDIRVLVVVRSDNLLEETIRDLLDSVLGSGGHGPVSLAGKIKGELGSLETRLALNHTERHGSVLANHLTRVIVSTTGGDTDDMHVDVILEVGVDTLDGDGRAVDDREVALTTDKSIGGSTGSSREVLGGDGGVLDGKLGLVHALKSLRDGVIGIDLSALQGPVNLNTR